MFLFYHLLLAHLTADLAFQTKEMINWKRKSIWGSLVHGLIFIVIAGFFCVTYLNDLLFIVCLLMLTSVRVLTDHFKSKITVNGRLDNLATFLIDQSIRISMIIPVALIPQLKKPKYLFSSALSPLYNNKLLILYLSFFIITIYGGSFFLYYMKKTFVDPNSQFGFDPLGMMERLFVFFSFLIGGAWLLLIPIVVLLKSLVLFLGIKSTILNLNEPALQFQKIKLKSNISFDMLISPVFSILMGIIVKSL